MKPYYDDLYAKAKATRTVTAATKQELIDLLIAAGQSLDSAEMQAGIAETMGSQILIGDAFYGLDKGATA